MNQKELEKVLLKERNEKKQKPLTGLFEVTEGKQKTTTVEVKVSKPKK